MTWTSEAAEHAKRVFPEESCGLLVKIDGEEQYWECKNISPEPEEIFIIDPDDWVEAEDVSDEIIAVVHSHPAGSADPSELDKESCERFRWPFYIFSVEKNEWHYLEPEKYIVCPRLKESTNTDPKLRTIRLYGRLAREVGWKTLHADVTNTSSVFTFLNANWPNIPYPEISQYYQVQIGEEYINNELLDLEVEGDIRIVPIVSGSIFGVIWGFVSTYITWEVVKTAIILTVIEYGIQKAIDWLTPKDSLEDEQEQEKGSIFSGNQNVSRSGIPVPILYGDVFTGSNVISSGVHAGVQQLPVDNPGSIDADELEAAVEAFKEEYAWSRGKEYSFRDNSKGIAVFGSRENPQILEIIDLWGEGEIEGFPSAASYSKTTQETLYNKAALKDVYVDGVPVLSKAASEPFDVPATYNVQSVKFTARFGTEDQTPIPENDRISTSVGYSDLILKEPNQAPSTVTKAINNTDANEAVVQIVFPNGMRNEDNKATGVTFQILVVLDTGVAINAFPNAQYHDWIDGGYAGASQIVNPDFVNSEGKVERDTTTSSGYRHIAYEKHSIGVLSLDYRIDLDSYRNLKYDPTHPSYTSENPDVGEYVREIRIERLGNNFTNPAVQGTFKLKAITEIIKETPNYFYSAYGKITLNSDNFQSIPRRMYHLRGTKIKIPAAYEDSNGTTYTPTVDSTNGRIIYPTGYVFSGTLTDTKHWCSDPAWILYDLITNQRHIPSGDIPSYLWRVESYEKIQGTSNVVPANSNSCIATDTLIQGKGCDPVYDLKNVSYFHKNNQAGAKIHPVSSQTIVDNGVTYTGEYPTITDGNGTGLTVRLVTWSVGSQGKRVLKDIIFNKEPFAADGTLQVSGYKVGDTISIRTIYLHGSDNNTTFEPVGGIQSFATTEISTIKRVAILASDRRNGYYDYGLGRDIDESVIDKYSLFEASKYASELVHGEPRISCNVVLKEQKQVYTIINDICSCFRSMPYYASGALQLSIDRPGESTYVFNRSNVGVDGFSYTGSPSEDRYTVVNVSYFNLDTKERDYVTVEADKMFTDKYGYQVKNLKSFACNSKAQAIRLGRWFIQTQHNEGETVTFSSSLHSGVLVRPGQIISISDPLRAGVRLGGRIASVTDASTFVIDHLGAGISLLEDEEISVLLPTAAVTTGSEVPYGKLETKSIHADTDGTSVVVKSAFSEAPAVGAPWVINKTDTKPIKYRVVGIGESDQLNYTITAMRYDEDKYDVIEANVEE